MPMIGADLAAMDALARRFDLAGTAFRAESQALVDRATEALDAFSRRNKGRQVTIEVDDPHIGAQVLARGVFAGTTYDRNDQRVEVMVGQGDDVHRHMMHSIPSVESIAMTTDERGGSEVLELRHGTGHTLVFVTG